MPETSKTPHSTLPYYIEPNKMRFCYFVVYYRDGTQFSQYEQDENGRYIAHHWPEVDLPNVKTFEAWGIRFEDGVVITKCLKTISVEPGMELMFKYRMCQHLSLNLKTEKALFGFKRDSRGNQKIWEIDHAFNVREHMQEEK